MSQNAKQLSLQIRRCATPSYFLRLYAVALYCVAVETAPLFVLCHNAFFSDSAKIEAFTWPFMAVICGRWSSLKICTCCGCMWMAHPDQADSLQGCSSVNWSILAAKVLGIGSGW